MESVQSPGAVGAMQERQHSHLISREESGEMWFGVAKFGVAKLCLWMEAWDVSWLADLAVVYMLRVTCRILGQGTTVYMFLWKQACSNILLSS